MCCFTSCTRNTQLFGRNSCEVGDYWGSQGAGSMSWDQVLLIAAFVSRCAPKQQNKGRRWCGNLGSHLRIRCEQLQRLTPGCISPAHTCTREMAGRLSGCNLGCRDRGGLRRRRPFVWVSSTQLRLTSSTCPKIGGWNIATPCRFAGDAALGRTMGR